jgi:hypothetical protein
MRLSTFLVTFAAMLFVLWMFVVVSDAQARVPAVDGNGWRPYQAPSPSLRPTAAGMRV